MNDTGYTTRPVRALSADELLTETLQAGHSAGFYAGALDRGATWSEYEPLLIEARDRRNACFNELRRRLEAAEALAVAAKPFAETSGLRQGINSVWQMNPRSIEEYNRLRDALRPFQKEEFEVKGVPPPDPWEDDNDWEAFCPKCGFLKIGHKGDACPQSDQEAMVNALDRQEASDA